MLKERFLEITAESGTGHLAKAPSLSPRHPSPPPEAAPYSEAPGRGRWDAEKSNAEPAAGPDPAGSSTGCSASARRWFNSLVQNTDELEKIEASSEGLGSGETRGAEWITPLASAKRDGFQEVSWPGLFCRF